MPQKRKSIQSQYVSFFINDNMFGLDIHVVREINPHTYISPVPLSKKHIRGLVNIRGQIVLVADIAVIFGYESRPVTSDSQLVIMKTAVEMRNIQGTDLHYTCELFGDKQIAFIVDRVGDVATVKNSDEESRPAHIDDTHAQFIRGVTRVDNSLMTILDPQALIAAC